MTEVGDVKVAEEIEGGGEGSVDKICTASGTWVTFDVTIVQSVGKAVYTRQIG